MRCVLSLTLAAVAAARTRNEVRGVPTGEALPAHMGDPELQFRVAGARPEQVKARPSLIDYNPVADAAAVVVSPDRMARFTVLTSCLIRMEYAKTPGGFEDHATIAMLNRKLDVPKFTQATSNGKLVISTSCVSLSYTLGQPFSAGSLGVQATDPSSAFKKWSFGDAFPGNLLGTIRGLDGQDQTPLNCTQNRNIDDNGEFNHCEWGVISRDGWVVYDDSSNFVLDGNDWWIPNNRPLPSRSCYPAQKGVDVSGPSRSSLFPDGTKATSEADCCKQCMTAPDCVAWVYDSSGSDMCYPLSGYSSTHAALARSFGVTTNETFYATLQNADSFDGYGFFHGHDYFGALKDFVAVSGKTIMVPKYASGVWWSRWLDLNNLDLVKVTDDYGSRALPLDVFVIDMDWHTKDDWSGFTFDEHLFPFPEDSMGYLHALGLPVTLNLHDASGVNSWDAKFGELVDYLGMPRSTKKVPFNIVNATVAYAVEDIVLGDLLYKKNVDFWWIDWQQGGSQGGMTGDKQNPTMWLNHLRCTDRHRVGDVGRAMVLARWGGLGGHRYQVGFSGDVNKLTWANLAYQPYFSATAANVAHGFWSHDIEGPSDDMEMYTRWIQVGAFSGTMRSHDRGMAGGECANTNIFSCAVVEPWNIVNSNWPSAFMEANRQALQFRAHLLPYVYNGHRSAFESGVGIVRPMYYHWPELDLAYAMDAKGNNVQYMFGPSMLFSPVITPGDAAMHGMGPGLAKKTTWLPPGLWVDVNTGITTKVTSVDYTVTKAYAVQQIPLWYVGGSVVPYIPLRSMPSSIGNAGRQYTFLGFKIVNGGTAGSADVYEDDGATTAYLTDLAYAVTTASYVSSGSSITVSISTKGVYKALPATRAYQLRLLNSQAVASVTVNGQPVTFQRFGKTASVSAPPAKHQHYYDFSALPDGMGEVIDLVGLSSSALITVTVVFAPQATASLNGVYGAVSHAIWAKANLDIERTTPGSNVNDPAPMSVVSSMGQALEYLAAASPANFSSTVASVPSLMAAAIKEISLMSKDVRAPWSMMMLQNGML